MKRKDACAILTKIAQSELISQRACLTILKARDVVVCEPNKILDVLATPQNKEEVKKELCNYLHRIIDDSMYDEELRINLFHVVQSIETDDWQPCDEMYISIRCKNCPCFKENSDET